MKTNKKDIYFFTQIYFLMRFNNNLTLSFLVNIPIVTL